MSDLNRKNLQLSLQEVIQSAPRPDWVQGMVEHYRRTGSYRSQDLHRLLGDPTKSVDAGPKICATDLQNRSNSEPQ